MKNFLKYINIIVFYWEIVIKQIVYNILKINIENMNHIFYKIRFKELIYY